MSKKHEQLDTRDPKFVLTVPTVPGTALAADVIEASVLWIRSWDWGIHLTATDGRSGWTSIRKGAFTNDTSATDGSEHIFAILAAAQAAGRNVFVQLQVSGDFDPSTNQSYFGEIYAAALQREAF